MIPIKDYNHRLEQQRQANALEIAELSTSKLNAIAERDEAVGKMTQVLQECRREAYTLRRLASNIAIHADTDIRSRSSNTADPVTSALAATTNKPVADIFNAAEETGTELREMVALVSTFSESLLRDFVSLRTSAVHQWFALQAEISKGTDTAHSVAASKTNSPTKDTSHSAIPTASLQELLQQNESMLGKLVSREKSTTLRLSRQYEEACAQKLQCEARIADLLVRIESLDAQLIDVQSSRQSTEHRCATEVISLFFVSFAPRLSSSHKQLCCAVLGCLPFLVSSLLHFFLLCCLFRSTRCNSESASSWQTWTVARMNIARWCRVSQDRTRTSCSDRLTTWLPSLSSVWRRST